MKVLLGRTFYGFGDWVMFTSLIKHINKQYPAVLVDVDATRLPLQFLQFLCKFDIRVTAVCYPNPEAYDVYIKHVAYRSNRECNKHLLEYMVEQFNEHVGAAANRGLYTDLKLKYDATCLAQYRGELKTKKVEVEGRFVIIAPENGLATSSQCKDWGIENFRLLAKTLSQSGIGVVQIGTGTAPTLWPGTHPVYSVISLSLLLDLMKQSVAVVTLENGVSHFAGHHGIRTYTIYRPTAPTKPGNTWYPYQTALIGEVIDPVNVANTIVKDMAEMELI